jgi:hypothetical protein
MPRKLGCRVGNGHREGLGAASTGSDSFSASRTAPSHPAGVSMPGPATMTGFAAAASRSRRLTEPLLSDNGGPVDHTGFEEPQRADVGVVIPVI